MEIVSCPSELILGCSRILIHWLCYQRFKVEVWKYQKCFHLVQEAASSLVKELSSWFSCTSSKHARDQPSDDLYETISPPPHLHWCSMVGSNWTSSFLSLSQYSLISVVTQTFAFWIRCWSPMWIKSSLRHYPCLRLVSHLSLPSKGRFLLASYLYDYFVFLI